MRATATLMCLTLAVAIGCSEKQADKESEPAQEPAKDPAGKNEPAGDEPKKPAAFDESWKKKHCEMLTTQMVAEASGVAADKLKQSTPGGWCQYEWDGGTATLMFINIKKDAETAAALFENAYGKNTGAKGFEFEEVPDVGDRAVLDKTKVKQNIRGTVIESYHNKLHILVGNMDFSLEYQTPDSSLNKDPLVALGKAVVATLR